MSTLSDSEQEAIWDGWSEIYRAQDEAEAERLGAWVCPVDRTMVPLGENCSECGCHPFACECWECQVSIGEMREEQRIEELATRAYGDDAAFLCEPYDGNASAWLCSCGTYVEEACHCSNCGAQAPWGCTCGLQDDIELRDDDDAFVYEPDEVGTSDHYYRGLDKPSGEDEWWLGSQDDDEQETP